MSATTPDGLPQGTVFVEVIERAVESLQQGNQYVDISVRGPLAEWLEDVADGGEGIISPYALALAEALLSGQERR
ncbi:hypothetical protein ACFRCI_48665 [Streptomyces sp. NPDC056638]|uniref:hypothetical protein n=1 Tax=Streptomyces sp. NPDC056638 TaxID=3345887 RepID=UPI00369D5ED5